MDSKHSVVISKPRAMRRPAVGGKWTKEEDEALKKLVEIHGAKYWKQVR